MPSLSVQPRDTPAERADAPVHVEVDEAVAVLAGELEEWASAAGRRQLAFREGHEFDRPNNVEARLLLANPRESSSLTFRLDQLEVADRTDHDLVLSFEEHQGMAKLVRLRPIGMDVELSHVRGALEL